MYPRIDYIMEVIQNGYPYYWDYFTHIPLLLPISNGTMPISMWRGGGMHSTEFRLVSFQLSCHPSLFSPTTCLHLSNFYKADSC